jgi:hypothetical protein
LQKEKKNMKATRQEVYAALDTERAYQDSKWGDSRSSGEQGAGERTLDEFALYIHGYADDLRRIASHTVYRQEKLDFIRKVGALCVAAMEQHGAEPRIVK